MPQLSLIRARLFGTPLAVHEPKLRAIVAGLGPRLGMQPSAYYDDDDKPRPPPRPYRVTPSGIAVVPIVGGLANRTGRIDAMSMPMMSYESILAASRMALADSAVRGLVWDIESPGGEARGCFEAAKSMAALRGSKPIIASANTYAYSAAFGLGTSADLFFVPETGQVGSIGVVALHVDESGADQKAGLAFEYIFAGAHKVDGHPHAPLTDDARSGIRADVDHLYGIFVAGVAANRRMAEDAVRATQARCLNAAEAISLGLADRMGTLEDAIAEAERLSSRTTSTRAGGLRQASQESTIMTDEEKAAAAAAEAAAKSQREMIAAEVAKATEAARAQVAAIMELCSTHGRPQDAAAHIAAGRSRGEVAEALLAAKAAQQQGNNISTAHGVGQEAGNDPKDPHGWNASAARVFGTTQKGA
ncbi:S49 family peptidase [Roseomonas sp. F4]